MIPMIMGCCAQGASLIDDSNLVILKVQSTGSEDLTVNTLAGRTSDIVVNWGDGSLESTSSNSISHTYSSPGEYTARVRVDGTALVIRHSGSAVVEVVKFSEVAISQQFWLPNLVQVPEDYPSSITSAFTQFQGCALLNSPRISNWNTSNVTHMLRMFYGCSTFNQDLSGWDVSGVTNMVNMFFDCSLFDGDVSTWDISSTIDIGGMFYGCTSFNQDLSNWNTSNVTNMTSVFANATTFNQDISGWDTSNVTNMTSMFGGASAFNQDISNWDTSNVTDMGVMFGGASAFNQDLSGWCVSKIPEEPEGFDVGATSWTLPRPVWGTCPNG